MEEKIYGVDLNKDITPLMVRDAIIECFKQAHCEDSGIAKEDEIINKQYCGDIVRKAFSDTDSNFDKPTKDMIIKSLDNLKSFSLNFRDKSIIEKHYNQILKLVNKLK
ncbi:MAG: hypothetical protein WCW65_03040 [Candidatus Paceibacterota bacterium]